jgi:hypothetical protein
VPARLLFGPAASETRTAVFRSAEVWAAAPHGTRRARQRGGVGWPDRTRPQGAGLQRPRTTDKLAEAVALQNEAMRQTRDRQLPLLDGRNRLMAMQRVGMLETEAALKDLLQRSRICYADEATPEEFVMSANVHRRHLAPDDKRKIIAALLKANPERSDRAIAQTAQASHHTVADVRAEAERRGQIAHVATRTDTAGRQQPATKPPKLPSKLDQIRALRERQAVPPTNPVVTATGYGS